MSTTCGYLCPKCEGRNFLEDGSACDWCATVGTQKTPEISDEEWHSSVHEGNCCGGHKEE